MFSRLLRKLFPMVAAVGLALCATAPQANAQVTTDVYLTYGFEDGTPFSDYVGTLNTPAITFATDFGYNWHPFGLGNFGSHSYGFLDVAATGSYTFSLDSDDGSSFYIDGILKIGNFGGHPPILVTNTFALTAGLHNFDVNFYEDFGGRSGLDLNVPQGVSFTAAVPEPGTYAMLLAGLGLVGFAVRRRKQRA